MSTDELIIACTLDPSLVQERVEEWRRLVSASTAMEHRFDGVRLAFSGEQPPSARDVAALAEAEHDCCPFFTFVLRIDDDGLTLDVTAPPSARPLVDVLLSLEAAA